MGLSDENVEAVQKSWEIAKSVAKIRYLRKVIRIKKKS
jgi:hypothetical protein